MKHTHKCPKCGSDDVLRIPGGAYGGALGEDQVAREAELGDGVALDR